MKKIISFFYFLPEKKTDRSVNLAIELEDLKVE